MYIIEASLIIAIDNLTFHFQLNHVYHNALLNIKSNYEYATIDFIGDRAWGALSGQCPAAKDRDTLIEQPLL